MTSAAAHSAPVDLGDGLGLTVMDAASAASLAVDFAAMPPWIAYPYPASALGAYLARVEPGAPRHLLTVDGNPGGAAGLRLDWLRGPYLQFLGILPAYQGRGLGSAFLAWLEREARATAQRNLWAAVADFNTDAVRFYARAGFVETARLDGLVMDGKTEILLRKRLA
jgi:GNAT superfamily N-acetyltransferase